MELLESEDPKGKLLKRSAAQRAALEDEVELFSKRTEKILTNTAIIGGALVVTYLLVTQLGKKSKGKNKKRNTKASYVSEEPSDEQHVSLFSEAFAGIGAMVISQATTFLLSLAKEKLMEYLEQQATQTRTDDHS